MNYVLQKLGNFAKFDYRVASLPHAVNAYENGSTWYPGMMSGDTVHPTSKGARNMYMELLCALPELMIGSDAGLLQTEKVKEQFSGSMMTVDSPEFVEGEYGFTFIADFTGDLEGSILVGNGKDTEGGTWVEINQEKVTVYTRKAGAAVKVSEKTNEIDLNEIVMIRVYVKNSEATISLVSSGEIEGRENTLFSATATWGYAGKAFALSTDTRLNDAQLSFVYEK